MSGAWRACVIGGAALGGVLLAQEDVLEERYPFSRLCGSLKYVHRTYEGNVVKDRNEKRLRKVKLQVYSRSANRECCAESDLVQEQTTGFWGGFNFKKLPDGKYWLVAHYEGFTYKTPVRVARDKKDTSKCFDQGFTILSNGSFEPWITVVLDGD